MLRGGLLDLRVELHPASFTAPAIELSAGGYAFSGEERSEGIRYGGHLAKYG